MLLLISSCVRGFSFLVRVFESLVEHPYPRSGALFVAVEVHRESHECPSEFPAEGPAEQTLRVPTPRESCKSPADDPESYLFSSFPGQDR